MVTFPEDPFETVKARIVGGDKRHVVRVLGGEGVLLGCRRAWSSCL